MKAADAQGLVEVQHTVKLQQPLTLSRDLLLHAGINMTDFHGPGLALEPYGGSGIRGCARTDSPEDPAQAAGVAESHC